MQHTLVALVENKPGVLSRVASLFQRRSFNIDSLTVGRTENNGISRITVVVDTDKNSAERLIAYLNKLINVVWVEDITDCPMVSRDLAIVKVSVNSANRGEVMQLVDVFRARIIDVANNSLMIEITGGEEKIEGLIEMLKPFGILEMVRAGVVAMGRGPSPLGYRVGNGNGTANSNASAGLGN
jgi:acetolactate synthase-1/3 small subunit